MSDYAEGEPGFVAGSETSEAAAENQLLSRAGIDRKRVRDFVAGAAWRGATCDEMEVALNLKHQTCSARCTDLKRDHAIFPSGRKRLTRGNCEADVYVIEDFLSLTVS